MSSNKSTIIGWFVEWCANAQLTGTTGVLLVFVQLFLPHVSQTLISRMWKEWMKCHEVFRQFWKLLGCRNAWLNRTADTNVTYRSHFSEWVGRRSFWVHCIRSAVHNYRVRERKALFAPCLSQLFHGRKWWTFVFLLLLDIVGTTRT